MKLDSIAPAITFIKGKKSRQSIYVNGKLDIIVTEKELEYIYNLIKKAPMIYPSIRGTTNKKLTKKFLDFIYKKTGRRYT